MGLLTFSINVTLDGCVDHREGIADDETHAFFTRLMDEGGAMLWGRVTYEMMESYGARQDSCRLIHAACGCLSVACDAVVTTQSRSGLSVTAPMGDQLRVCRDQRAGLRSRALAYSAWRAARIA